MCIITFSYYNCLHLKEDKNIRRIKFLIKLHFVLYSKKSSSEGQES